MESLSATPVESGELQPELFELNIEQDAAWFTALFNGKELSEETLARANDLIALGSAGTKANVQSDRAAYDSIVAARYEFFGDLLGWGDSEHPMHAAYTYYLRECRSSGAIPLSTTIRAWRTIEENGCDVAQVLSDCPQLIGYSANVLQEKFDNLVEQSVGKVSAVSGNAAILATSIPTLNGRISNFNSLGADGAAVITEAPSLANYSAELINKEAQNFDELGIDAVRVLKSLPALYEISISLIREKVANFEAKNIQASTLNSNLRLLKLSMSTIDQRFNHLASKDGVDAAEVVNKYGGILLLPEPTLDAKLALFEKHSVDSSAVLNNNPVAFSKSTKSLSQRIITAQRYASILQWRGDINSLIANVPGVLNNSQSKIAAHTRLAAAHGEISWRDATENEIMSNLMAPLDSHMQALVTSNQTNEPYTTNAARRARHQYPASERRELVLEGLDDETIRKNIGRKCLRAYFKNRPLSSAELERHPHLAGFAKK